MFSSAELSNRRGKEAKVFILQPPKSHWLEAAPESISSLAFSAHFVCGQRGLPHFRETGSQAQRCRQLEIYWNLTKRSEGYAWGSDGLLQ